MIKNIKKILIFKLCCFGDTVFITPAIKSLKENFPEAKIIYAHSKWVGSIINYIPFIDGDILFEHVYGKNIFKKIYGTLKFIKRTRREKFDLVFVGHRSNVLSLILKACSIKYRLGFRTTKHLTHTGIFRSEQPEFRRYLQIFSENGLKTSKSPPELIARARDITRKSLGLNSDTQLLGIYPMGGINPGTIMHIKRLDLENYFKLIPLLNKEFPKLNIIIFEGKMNEEKIGALPEINAFVREIDNDLISACDYFISGDTGSLHIAAAMGISTLAIFGPSNPGILAPVNTPGHPVKHGYIWKAPFCSPCYTADTAFDRKNRKYWSGQNFICHTGTHECMNTILPEEIFAEFIKLFSNNINN
jgi:heptosyltransferase-2